MDITKTKLQTIIKEELIRIQKEGYRTDRMMQQHDLTADQFRSPSTKPMEPPTMRTDREEAWHGASPESFARTGGDDADQTTALKSMQSAFPDMAIEQDADGQYIIYTGQYGSGA